MKAAVTAQGKSMEAEVDPRFGRARHFVVVDTETGDFSVADNRQSFDAAQGAGIQAGSNVAALGVTDVVTGHMGPKAFRTLQAAGIRVHIGATGTVREAIEQLKAGTLQPADGADVEGHWV